MTTGEYLLSKSPLPSGTALAHLLAMQTGGGQGTVFASMFSVSVEQPSVTVIRKSSRQPAPIERLDVQPARRDPVKQRGAASVFSVAPSIAVLTVQEELFVMTGTSSRRVMTQLDSTTISKRND